MLFDIKHNLFKGYTHVTLHVITVPREDYRNPLNISRDCDCDRKSIEEYEMIVRAKYEKTACT